MLPYIIAGLVMGGIYAISAAGLVVTYQSAGILNFSFGAIAYFVARFFYFLHTQQSWSIPEAAILSLLVVGPASGIFLYLILFRLLRLASTLVKVVVTLGLSVSISPAAALAFGTEPILQAPGLAPRPVRVFHVVGVPVTMDQIIVYAAVIVVMVGGALALRYTDIGLRVRAMVDSPAMTSLTGTSPTSISLGVWAASTFLAGLAGVLSAPIIGLDPNEFTLLTATAFAAVIAARLRNLPVAVSVGLLMGIATALVERYLPPSSSLTAAVLPSIPFAVTACFLIYQIVRQGHANEGVGVGGALDRAIAVNTQIKASSHAGDEPKVGLAATARSLGWGPSLLGLAIVAVLPLLLHGFWVGLVAEGVCYGVILLSFSLVIGDGGMVWLCMVTFAGVGGITTGQLAGVYGWPLLAAVAVGGVMAAGMGIVIGMLTIRLGNLYVALATLAFALLADSLIFNRTRFVNQGLGVPLNRPSFAIDDKAFTYLALAIFALVALFIVNLRRSTTGMALSAVRWSETAAKMTGVSVLQQKVLIAGVAAFIAAIGGALLAIQQNVAQTTNYTTLGGLVWLCALVTQGIRSNAAAMFAGLTLTILPGVVQAYLPQWVVQVTPVLFGLGAIAIAAYPEGLLAEQARRVRVVGGTFRQLAQAVR